MLEQDNSVILTYFNAKILELFQKMYSFKIIEPKGDQNR